jgi:hypothetical protein
MKHSRAHLLDEGTLGASHLGVIRTVSVAMTDANSRDRDKDEIFNNIQIPQAACTVSTMMQNLWVRHTGYLLNTHTTLDIFYLKQPTYKPDVETSLYNVNERGSHSVFERG